MIRLARRPSLPIAGPLFGAVTGAMRRVGLAELSEDFRRLLRYGRAVDTTPARGGGGLHAPVHHGRGGRGLRGGGGLMGPGAATGFLRRLREGLDAGLDLPEAPARSAAGPARGARERVGAAARRLEGDYQEDEWGFDEEFAAPGGARVRLPLRPLVAGEGDRGRERARARPRAAGGQPRRDPALGRDDDVVAIMREHPLPRYPRFLVLNWAFELPYVSMAIRKVGGVVASPHNALRLLEQDQLVAVFPEGVKGTGKPYAERYRLQRFGRGGFVELALRTGAPIVPVAVVGSEEIYPKLGEAPLLARLTGAPFFPLTPLFPWLGPARVPCRCRRSGGSSSASRSRPPPTAPTPPTTARWCSSCPSGCRSTVQQDALLESRAPGQRLRVGSISPIRRGNAGAVAAVRAARRRGDPGRRITRGDLRDDRDRLIGSTPIRTAAEEIQPDGGAARRPARWSARWRTDPRPMRLLEESFTAHRVARQSGHRPPWAHA